MKDREIVWAKVTVWVRGGVVLMRVIVVIANRIEAKIWWKSNDFRFLRETLIEWVLRLR